MDAQHYKDRIVQIINNKANKPQHLDGISQMIENFEVMFSDEIDLHLHLWIHFFELKRRVLCLV